MNSRSYGEGNNTGRRVPGVEQMYDGDDDDLCDVDFRVPSLAVEMIDCRQTPRKDHYSPLTTLSGLIVGMYARFSVYRLLRILQLFFVLAWPCGNKVSWLEKAVRATATVT